MKVYPPGRLPIWVKARLAVEVSRTYRWAKGLIATENLPDALAEIRATTTEGEPVPLHEGLRLGRAVAKTLTKLPADNRCLMQSVVLTAMLARRATPVILVIGVQQPGETFGAHAWVEIDGKPLLPTGGDQFARLVEL